VTALNHDHSMTARPASLPVNAEALTYEMAGVNYDQVDPIKLMAQQSAKATSAQLAQHGMDEIAASRGESAYVLDVGPFYLASIVECLGTKILVADAVYRETSKSFYAAIAQDTIAMAVNDLITVGATPLVVQAYWAAGGSDWFADKRRAADLIKGWKAACEICGVSWGGGETPALAGVVEGGTIDLGASCTGIVKPKSRLSLGDNLNAGDAIVILASSGIHANGVSLARKLAERLPNGYLTDIGNGEHFGEALLAPTTLYAPVTEALAKAGVAVNYCVNITGHGWRKLLRHTSTLTYRIHTVPPVPPVLAFMQTEAKLDHTEAYGTLNMGAGFAFFVSAAQAEKTVAIARECGIDAWVAGAVEAGPKQVIIEPIGVTYGAEDLKLR
jgi:phosphoribosylformylglycinamidine cyclo-ligase